VTLQLDKHSAARIIPRQVLLIWGQSKNYPRFGPRFPGVNRRPVSAATWCLKLSFPSAIPLLVAPRISRLLPRWIICCGMPGGHMRSKRAISQRKHIPLATALSDWHPVLPPAIP